MILHYYVYWVGNDCEGSRVDERRLINSRKEREIIIQKITCYFYSSVGESHLSNVSLVV